MLRSPNRPENPNFLCSFINRGCRALENLLRGGFFLRAETGKGLHDAADADDFHALGFPRVENLVEAEGVAGHVAGHDDVGFVAAKLPNTRWYPAYEVRGEGIFIEFNEKDIETWIAQNPEVTERAKHINDNYSSSFLGRNHPRNITPKFLMLHTLSHLLISQLSFECGYSIASLSERIYCSEQVDGKTMSGIFIYTASGDSEGTLGGLVRQGRADAFPKLLRKAITSAKTCSNDPVCILSRGQGRDSLNLAACHACALLPETCCEERNAFLDRGVLVGTYDNPHIGFWDELLRDIS